MIVKLEKVKRKAEVVKIAPKLVQKIRRITKNYEKYVIKQVLRSRFKSKLICIINYDLNASLTSNFSVFFAWHSLSSLSHFISVALFLWLLQPPAITGKPIVEGNVVRQTKVIKGNNFFILLLSYVNILCFIN